MNSNPKTHKSKGIVGSRKLKKISGLIQIMEITIFLIFVTSQIPSIFKYSTQFFQDFSTILSSPRVVFFIGNAIVIVLFANSGHFRSPEASRNVLYEEFVEQSEINHRIRRIETKYEEKQGKTEENRVIKTPITYKTTLSVNLGLDCGENVKSGSMRRSQTEKCLKTMSSGDGKAAKKAIGEEKMSKDEFRSKIEAFIARQQRMRRGET